jgi:hypothetical protein
MAWRNTRHLVGGQIIHDDDIAGRQRGNQAALDISAEDLAVHRVVDDKGRGYCIDTQPRHQGRGLPMTMRHAPDQTRPAPAAATLASHVGGGAGLVNEDQLLRIQSL